MQQELVYPESLQDLTDFLHVRLTEPCSRGALKGVHRVFVFLEEISGVTSAERISTGQLYAVVYKEMLASAIPGKLHKQAPRMLISMIAALEILVADIGSPPYLRIFSWWLLVQNWRTLRFTDHRGLCLHTQCSGTVASRPTSHGQKQLEQTGKFNPDQW